MIASKYLRTCGTSAQIKLLPAFLSSSAYRNCREGNVYRKSISEIRTHFERIRSKGHFTKTLGTQQEACATVRPFTCDKIPYTCTACAAGSETEATVWNILVQIKRFAN